MNITLSPDLERRVRERIDRGDYDDVEALVHEAVHRLIEEDERDIDALREQLRRADAEIDRGEGLEFDEQTTRHLAEDIHARGRKRLEKPPQTATRG
jgi:putative addiction module CopG family antidote